MVGQRLRRWPSINPLQSERLVLAGQLLCAHKWRSTRTALVHGMPLQGIHYMHFNSLHNTITYNMLPGTSPDRTTGYRIAHINKALYSIFLYRVTTYPGGGPDAVVKATCLESRRSKVRTPLWHSSFRETACFSQELLTRKYSILRGASVTEKK